MMEQAYRITALDKKSVVVTNAVYEDLADGTTRGWSVEETYRWGYGFRSEQDPVTEWELGNNGIHCEATSGFACAELTDLCACFFEFDAGFTDEEKQLIENNWHEGGMSWLHDGEHNWQVEESTMLILGPVLIDLIDTDTDQVIESNVEPKPNQTSTWSIASAAWPFPTE
jgi:hypothetical protein